MVTFGVTAGFCVCIVPRRERVLWESGRQIAAARYSSYKSADRKQYVKAAICCRRALFTARFARRYDGPPLRLVEYDIPPNYPGTKPSGRRRDSVASS